MTFYWSIWSDWRTGVLKYDIFVATLKLNLFHTTQNKKHALTKIRPLKTLLKTLETSLLLWCLIHPLCPRITANKAVNTYAVAGIVFKMMPFDVVVVFWNPSAKMKMIRTVYIYKTLKLLLQEYAEPKLLKKTALPKQTLSWQLAPPKQSVLTLHSICWIIGSKNYIVIDQNI